MVIEGCKVLAVLVWFPGGIAKIPSHVEFGLTSRPTVRQYLVDKPFIVLGISEVIERLCLDEGIAGRRLARAIAVG